MFRTALSLALAFVLTSTLAAPADAAALEVGPGKKYDHPNKALADAKAGDTIRVSPGTYSKVALYVDKPRITIEAAEGDGPVVFAGKGFDYSGRGRTPRAIVQFNKGADECLIDGIELTGASNGSHNGAGIRINQANHVTVKRCHIHANDMGIMSNGDGTADAGVGQLIAGCHIHHNGNLDDPGYNHNLYLGGASVALVDCEVHHATTGHNVKSRAHHNTILGCRIYHSANREVDLVDAKETALPESHAIIVDSAIVKDPKCRGNKGVIHFGAESGEHNGTIHIVNSVIVTPFGSPVVDLSAKGAGAKLINTIIYNPGPQRNPTLLSVRGGASMDNVSVRSNWVSQAYAGSMPDRLAREIGHNGTKSPPFGKSSEMDYRLERTAPFDAGTAVTDDDLPSLEPVEPVRVWRKALSGTKPTIGLP